MSTRSTKSTPKVITMIAIWFRDFLNFRQDKSSVQIARQSPLKQTASNIYTVMRSNLKTKSIEIISLDYICLQKVLVIAKAITMIVCSDFPFI